MKRAIGVLLAACTALAMAEEAASPAAPSVEAPPYMSPETVQRLFQKFAQVLPDGSLQIAPAMPVHRLDPSQLAQAEAAAARFHAGLTCYFIRSLGPPPTDPDAQRRGLIPLQAHAGLLVHRPDCTSGSELQSIPVSQQPAPVTPAASAPAR